MCTDYRTSHIALGKGHSYHEEFSTNPHRAMVWQFEKAILDQILATYYQSIPIRHLDFACGTGRILGHLTLHASVSVGVDVSPSMLEIARIHCPGSEIIQADMTRTDVLVGRTFNLITAFRFFANAEHELRLEVAGVIGRHLEGDGYFVFNNHKHTGSTRNRLAKLVGRRHYRGMSSQEVAQVLEYGGLEVVETYSLCIFPASEKHLLLPIRCLTAIEAQLSKCALLKSFGENIIYVCRRKPNSL